ncbi:nicotinate phosphoribosyltransferase [Cohnella nanjingensis]|uniref:Nicotinate phosphoribosyltransferase n=1 Tax=Cohnella nanjingensis TaxID=1387779 RepID=A0A7X0VH01_9BACL|nr:nicotinate phosphoribosyltransferase [Cohnella nanjingensis]MBB6673615.1 nicotinate phosphoribosyltransferase [Cohnella nanjingensis]
MNAERLTLHTDKYQINMMYAHWVQGSLNDKAVFEIYFRKLPFGNGFAVFAGLERVVRYLADLRFGDEELAYLREQEEGYDEAFLALLREFRFTGRLHAVPEGTIVFPNVPLARVEARLFEAHLIETALLNFVNYQTLIATKAARIKLAAPDDILLEFGTRRAQEADAAVWGARAAYIAGFHATSNMRAGMMFGIPTKGTHAHAWVQAHDTEEEAFRKYAEALPDQVTLLVDTYDTLRDGLPDAIKIARMLERQGKRMNGIRLDSGDLAYLSQRAREMLDEEGLNYVKITASNDLDENIIFNLKSQGARIDIWGVGTKLITANDQPSLGGVYKLVAREKEGRYEPVIKISANPDKVTNPGFKEAYRIVSRRTGKAEGDYITLRDEEAVARGERIKLFDPVHPYIHKYVEDYEAIPLLVPVIDGGAQVGGLPRLDAIRDYHAEQFRLFWPQYLRKLNPEQYRVSLSEKAWELKMSLVHRHPGVRRGEGGAATEGGDPPDR